MSYRGEGFGGWRQMAATNSTAALSFHHGRSVLFRNFGTVRPIASRTIRRARSTSWRAHSELVFLIVPTNNSEVARYEK